MSADLLCGTGRIAEECIGATVDRTENGAKALINEISSTAMTIMKAMVYFGGKDLSKNMIKGINAMRCVFTSGFDNSWTLLLAGYYAAAQFGKAN